MAEAGYDEHLMRKVDVPVTHYTLVHFSHGWWLPILTSQIWLVHPLELRR